MSTPSCSEVKSFLDIESYAYVGKIRSISIHECGRKRKYVVVETSEGRKVCSPCSEEDVVNLSVKMMEFYLNNTKLILK